MAIIKSGASSDLLTIDPTSKAARVTMYDTRGNAMVMKAGYCAGTTAKFAAAAGTTVFAMMAGSATTTIRVQRITVGGSIATTSINADLVLYKRTALGSGGTPSSLTPIAKDSNSAGSGATNVKVFTAGPTAGTGGGVLATTTMFMGVTPALSQIAVFDWTMFGMEAPVLRGVNDSLELSFGTTQANISTMTVWFEWTEE